MYSSGGSKTLSTPSSRVGPLLTLTCTCQEVGGLGPAGLDLSAIVTTTAVTICLNQTWHSRYQLPSQL